MDSVAISDAKSETRQKKCHVNYYKDVTFAWKQKQINKRSLIVGNLSDPNDIVITSLILHHAIKDEIFNVWTCFLLFTSDFYSLKQKFFNVYLS